MRNTWQRRDNGDLSAKINLRRHFLRKYHAEPPSVFDACQGDKVLWSVLVKEFVLAGYWGVDVKKKAGRLHVDSARVLGLPGWTWDVIDVDSYGCPWKQWLALLPNVMRLVTVFLTLGSAGRTGMKLAKVERAALGVDGLWCGEREQWFGSFGRALSPLAAKVLLASANQGGLRVVEAARAVSRTSNAQYFGLRIERRPAA